MSQLPLRRCRCGRLTRNRPPRCDSCGGPQSLHTRADRRRRREAIAAHVARRGWWCPGFGEPPHQSHDLTADHVAETAAGGDVDGELRVLCRRCNTRRSAGWAPGV